MDCAVAKKADVIIRKAERIIFFIMLCVARVVKGPGSGSRQSNRGGKTIESLHGVKQ